MECVVIPKSILKLLPNGLRSFTEVEALVFLSINNANGKTISMRECSKIWGWPWSKTRRFICVNQKRTKSEPSNTNQISMFATPLEPKVNQKRTKTEGKYPSGFSEFWGAYPRKVAKSDALKAWNSEKAEFYLTKILKALQKHKTAPDWVRDNGQWVPYPATWIRGHRWEDEVEIVQPRPSQGLKSVAEIVKERGY